MIERKTLWIGLVTALLAGAVVGGLGTYLAIRQQTSTLEDQLAASERARAAAGQAASPTAGGGAGAAVTATPQPTTPSASVPATAAAKPSGAGGSGGKPKPAPMTVRQYAFVKKLTVTGGSYSMVADYAEFLTGKAAASAAKARGDESPPPNDYYIVNDNPKLRTLPVRPGAKITLFEKPEGSHVAGGYTVSLATWKADLSPSAPNVSIRTNGYWLTIVDGTVTAAEEVWVP
jgi:hypothetical protein